MNFQTFPSIQGFHNIVKLVDVYPHVVSGPVVYRGKIKIHGTNAGIRIVNGEIAAQSRSRFVTIDDDNMCFAKWVEAHKEHFINIKGDYTIFGEFCGPGIAKGTAINKIPNKVLAVFAIQDGVNTETCKMITGPAKIKEIIGEVPDVHILPWATEPLIVNFADRSTLQLHADSINTLVKEIEKCDPWVKSTFGVEGICEGIVYVPCELTERKQYSDLAFKAKGEDHKHVKTKESVEIDPVVAASIEHFIELFVTEPRLQQGLEAIGGDCDIKNTGPFIKWVCSDIFKESKDELAASNLTWEQSVKSVSKAVREWFMAQSKVIS